MMAQYSVHFSEEDFFNVDGDCLSLYPTSTPIPETGQFVVRNNGIYEISYVEYTIDNYYNITVQPILTQILNGDVIVVQNKDRYYRCINKDGVYGFKKINLLTLLKQNNNLEDRLDQLQEHVNQLQKYVNELIH